MLSAEYINPYKLNLLGNSIVLEVANRIENNSWFLFYGEVQSRLLSFQNSNILLDLSQCTHFSPEPFLSLCLTLYSCKENNNSLKVKLPHAANQASNRFLKYCTREGFYSLLKWLDNNIDPIEEISSSVQSAYKSLNFHPIIPAQIIDINDRDVSVVTQSLIESIVSYGINLNQHDKNDLRITLRNILFELIDNVKRHAYLGKNIKKKYFAVYVRARFETDITRNQGISESTVYRKIFLPPDVFNETAIELYFLDIGEGLVTSWMRKKFLDKDTQRPLREIMQKQFFKPKHRLDINVTANSGLSVIQALLLRSNSIIKIVTSDESSGGFVENARCISENSIRLRDLDYKQKRYFPHTGLSYTFHLFVRKHSSEQHIIDLAEMNLISYTQKFSGSFEKVNVVDNRIYAPRVNFFSIFNKNNPILYYFISSNNFKQTIIQKLQKLIKDNEQTKKLLVCDVDIGELRFFDYALNGTSAKILSKALTEIIIITQNFRVVRFVLCNETSRYKIDKQYDFSNLNKEFNYIYQLKLYESTVLLSLLRELHIEEYVLTKGNVKWGDTIISGFINFDILISNSLLYNFAKHNLIRVFSLIKCAHIHPIEFMVQRLAEEINDLTMCINENGSIYYLGSVYSSGSTLLSTKASIDKCIHFFDRSKMNEGIVASLFFSPDRLLSSTNNNDSAPEYERVGKTQKIRRICDGKKSITVNSYLSSFQTYELLHQYAYSPVACGHYIYEGRHSLLAFDFIAMLKDPSSKLARFLIELISSSLEHYERKHDYLNHHYWRILKDTCMIVYLSHYLTEETLQKCGYDYNKYSQYILGLNHRNILRHDESLEFSEIFSDLILKNIEAYKTFKENQGIQRKDIIVKMVVFDSIISSGRTRKEIKQYLLNLGCDIVIFTSIIDAQCYRYNKPDTYKCYMDLSFPTLGKNNSCAICEGLSVLKNISNSFICYQLLCKVKIILSNWDIKGIFSVNNNIKLTSFPEIYASSFDIPTGNYLYEDIRFTKAIPLYFYISHRIKLENDFCIFERFLDSQLLVDPDSLLYLCSLFIVEYKNVCYFRLLAKVYEFMLDYLEEANDAAISELALLSLLTIDQDTQENLLIEYLQKREVQIPIKICKQLYYAAHYREIVSRQDNDLLKACIALKVKVGNTQLDAYRQFHYQLINTRGEIHDPPLKRILINFSEENKLLALSSLALLKASLTNNILDFYYLFENSKAKEMEASRQSLLEILNELQDELQQELRDPSHKDTYYIIQPKVKNVYNYAIQIHDALFVKADLKGTNKGIGVVDAFDNIIDMYNKAKCDSQVPKMVYFFRGHSLHGIKTEKASDFYYIWNSVLEREILYTLTNVSKHAAEKYFCQDNQLYYGVAEIILHEDEVILEISNLTTKTAQQINNELNERYGISAIRNLGIQLSYEEISNVRYLGQKGVKAVFRIPNIEYVH